MTRPGQGSGRAVYGPRCCLTLGAALVLVLATSCSSPPAQQSLSGKTTLSVFEADSLMVPFAQVEREFEAANPTIDVRIEAHGSIQVIRQVTELGQDVDVVAVADYSLIPMLMYQTSMPSGKPYGDWYIKPATNTLVLAYSAKSKYASEVTASNWYDIVTRPDVRFGLADPRMDAVGYRTLMLGVLAGSYYGDDTLMGRMVGNCFTTRISESEAGGITTISVPEVLEPSTERLCLRGANMQLLALLESGDVDYTFDYKSVVLQHKLNYVELPSQINMGDPSLAAEYGKVEVKLDFRRFKTVDPVFAGLPIGYGVTIPANARHPLEAAKFVAFILGPDGQRIFEQNNHRELIPPECDDPAALPETLKQFFP